MSDISSAPPRNVIYMLKSFTGDLLARDLDGNVRSMLESAQSSLEMAYTLELRAENRKED